MANEFRNRKEKEGEEGISLSRIPGLVPNGSSFVDDDKESPSHLNGDFSNFKFFVS